MLHLITAFLTAVRVLFRNRVDTSHSEAITGKTADSVPLEGHEHAHYLATDKDDDGRLDHLSASARGPAQIEKVLGAEQAGWLKGTKQKISTPEIR